MDTTLRNELVDLTSELMRFESTADRPDQLAAVIDYTAAYLAKLPGIAVQHHERAGKPSLVASFGERREANIVLNAHLDVVHGHPQQFAPTLDGDKLRGRGSQDMKGSAAVLLLLLKAFATQEYKPDLAVQFVSDEEIGGAHGTAYLLEEGYRCRFFLAAEPTDLGVCHLHKGALWMEIRIGGDPAHASRPWDGRNAILGLRDGLVRLEQRFPALTTEAWATTVTPTVVHGGSSRNRLPEDVVLSIDCRRVPEDDPDTIVAAVRACFPEGELTVKSRGTPLQTNPDDPFIGRLAAITRAATGHEPRRYGEHFASDARFYSAAGIPAICFGPVGKGLHSDDEWVSADGLVGLYDILHKFVTEEAA